MRQDKAGQVFGRVWNRTEPNHCSKPRPIANTTSDREGAHHSQIHNFSTGYVYSATGYLKVQWSNLDPYAMKNLDKEDSGPVMLTNEDTSTAQYTL
jgi:hypothetical protein